MLKLLKDSNRLHEAVFMLCLSLFCFGASIFRCLYTHTFGFIFLNWNLFLAFIPWALSTFLTMSKKRTNVHDRIFTAIVMLVWLLFFPNAPYILTDLFHLRRIALMPIWFDLVMILSFAWTGLLFGFLSLWDIERMLSARITKRRNVKIISSVLLFVGSFGVYIGRYLRWNSWDIVAQPFRVLRDITDRIINPFGHQTTWGLTIFMGIFLNMIYWSLDLLRTRKTVNNF
ncbi:MAG: DUF1361 domain-containing protein [Treponemataceae bacterium]|nr:MAG: DUF1361 domain-containing protein [Treponemataceae bacterium]